MKKYTKIFHYSLLAVACTILLVFLFLYVLLIHDDNEFHTKEIKYIEMVGQKVGNYYLENNKLPANLQEVEVSENYPYPPIRLFDVVDYKRAGDYRLIYHPIGDKNFTLVMTNKQKYVIYYYSSNWEEFKNGGRFRQAMFVYNPEPYKSEQFLRNRQNPPFNQASSWPDI